ncbi:Oidioi.mRNA.OKI2018_I69.chr1.g1961.t1.cds [Oikopleura dioica]|uniref:Oidioi.mRNA.OKI2018_I69.chr1.g1961.t1.cds n=1 Tax=Oikopleura dioica TaxID=34765 RepID=A0ABN7SWI7_OIKDI|nr:Oidioi.mRNA.OKI2018_I69.chr1.g1961.t1.cds [Oikopleura dioica]
MEIDDAGMDNDFDDGGSNLMEDDTNEEILDVDQAFEEITELDDYSFPIQSTFVQDTNPSLNVRSYANSRATSAFSYSYFFN